MQKLFRLIATLCGLLSALSQCAYAGDPVEADRVVAVVGNEVITYYDLRIRLQGAIRQLQKQGTPLPPENEMERQMLERLITDRAQIQAARENGLRIDDLQLDQTIARIAANNKMNVTQFRQALAQDGVEYTRFREDIRDEMTQARLREREVDSRLVISEAEIDNYLANQQAAGNQDELQLAHILFRAPDSATPEQLQKLRMRAEQVLKRALAGENFAQLAAGFSDAPDALKGGEIGWRTQERLPGLYAEAAKGLSEGQVSDLLRSSAGFHLIKLIGKRGPSMAQPPVQQTRARHILIRSSEVLSESEARHRLEGLRDRLTHGGADFAELARVFSQDGSAPKGGDLGWLSPGDTVPEFERGMDALQIGEISPVIQSPFGFHLIQVQERRQRDMTEERQRATARQALRERKLDEAYQDWLRQLRDRTYVENRLQEQ